MSDGYQVGDVVQLKSGGPKMTVEMHLEDYLQCKWFDDTQKVQSDSFAVATLQKVHKNKIPPPQVIAG